MSDTIKKEVETALATQFAALIANRMSEFMSKNNLSYTVENITKAAIYASPRFSVKSLEAKTYDERFGVYPILVDLSLVIEWPKI